jgi:bifunctional non-homologous end joining protein LigD
LRNLFYAFDLPILAGKDLTQEPLQVRHELLRSKLMPVLAEPIQFSQTLRASPADLIRTIREHGPEGIVAKRLDGANEPVKRFGVWVKMRVTKGQELVIGGCIPAAETLYLGWLLGGKGPAVRGQGSKRIRTCY